MSRNVLSAMALAAALVGSVAHAAPPGPARGELPTPPPPAAPALAGQAVAQGTVQRMLINPYGEVDGLRLADGTVVKFAPHMGDALTNAVKTGDTVRVIGRPEARGTVRADAIVNAANGQTVYDQPPPLGEGRPLPPHLRAQKLQQQQVQGKVDTVLTGPRGEANGVILTDGSIVRFPPESLRQSVQPGAPFAASGLGTRNANGTSLEAVNLGTSLSALQPLYDGAR